MFDPCAGVKVSVSPLTKLLPNSCIVWLILSAGYEVGETLLKDGVGCGCPTGVHPRTPSISLSVWERPETLLTIPNTSAAAFRSQSAVSPGLTSWPWVLNWLLKTRL